MSRDKLMTISEFGRLSGISRDNLIFYGRSGLLKPERVVEFAENNLILSAYQLRVFS